MTKNEFKEFVKENKKKIAIGCLVAIAGVGVTGVSILRAMRGTTALRIEATAKTEEAKQALDRILEYGKAWDQMADGATNYIGWKAEDNITMFSDNIYTAPDGDKLKVTGAVLFGNKVET